ncbi:MAG: nuclear transport factor 2 family protein [Ilumatobacteraceae bacterium]
MIDQVVHQWHLYMKGQLEGGLDVLLADDCVFYSPIVFTPQVGKEITKMYLLAAGQTLPGDKKDSDGENTEKSGKFRYIKEVKSGNTAVLEFETTVEGKYANGVDIITCNDEGKIIEFKVMFRPLQAINAVHRQMGAMLEKMSPK